MEECCAGGASPVKWEQNITCRSEELIVASTFASIPDEIKRIPMSASEVQLNSKVVHVELHHSESGGGSITITTDSEQKRQLDDVVMTTPLSWLKAHKHAFTPSLEPRLLQAVDSISVGHLEKVYITFPRAFWMAPNTAEDEEPAGYST